MIARLQALKEALKQMQCAMADGHGDSEKAGREAMANLGDKADIGGAENKMEEDSESPAERKLEADAGPMGDLAEMKKRDFKGKGKNPMAGHKATKIMVAAISKKMPGKKMKYG